MYCLVGSFFWWYNKFDELWYWGGCIYVFWQVFGFVKARFPPESRRVWCRWIFQKFLFKRILYKKRFLSDSWSLSNCSAVLCLIRRARRGDKNWILTATAFFLWWLWRRRYQTVGDNRDSSGRARCVRNNGRNKRQSLRWQIKSQGDFQLNRNSAANRANLRREIVCFIVIITDPP